MPVFLIIAVLIAILAVTFALLNATPVTVSLFFVEFDGSLALVLLVTLGLGILIGFLGLLPSLIKYRLELSRQRKKILSMEGQMQTSSKPDGGGSTDLAVPEGEEPMQP